MKQKPNFIYDFYLYVETAVIQFIHALHWLSDGN